jgi:hypothetical protein
VSQFSPSRVKATAERLRQDTDTDTLLFQGPISPSSADTVVELCLEHDRFSTVTLILSTDGGDAHAAYRIARCL